MQNTLMIIKPDAASQNHTGEIIAKVEKEGFRVLAMEMTTLRREEAARFYEVHKGKDFYESLLDFMTSGRIVPMVLEREDAVEYLRKVIGATNPEEAEPETIRSDFATDVQNNAVHASDSPQNAEVEIAFFFGTKHIYKV